MKTIAILLAIVAVSVAAPRQSNVRQLRHARQSAIAADVSQERELQSSSQEQQSDEPQKFDESQQSSESFAEAQAQQQQTVHSRQQRQYQRQKQGQQNLKAPSQLQAQNNQLDQREVVILKQVPNNNIGLDNYHYSFDLSDGTRREEYAQVDNAKAATAPGEEPTAILRVKGFYSYVNPFDGKTYTVTYIADENGFQPQGEHLPTNN